jgi:hypothetical protein
MKAFVVEHYGRDGLRAADVPEPEVGDGASRTGRPSCLPVRPSKRLTVVGTSPSSVSMYGTRSVRPSGENAMLGSRASGSSFEFSASGTCSAATCRQVRPSSSWTPPALRIASTDPSGLNARSLIATPCQVLSTCDRRRRSVRLLDGPARQGIEEEHRAVVVAHDQRAPVRAQRDLEKAVALAAHDADGGRTAHEGCQDVAARLERVLQLDALPRKQQRAVEIVLDERLSAEVLRLGRAGLVPGLASHHPHHRRRSRGARRCRSGGDGQARRRPRRRSQPGRDEHEAAGRICARRTRATRRAPGLHRTSMRPSPRSAPTRPTGTTRRASTPRRRSPRPPRSRPGDDGGLGWPTIALGIVGSLLAVAAMTAIVARSRRLQRQRATA